MGGLEERNTKIIIKKKNQVKKKTYENKNNQGEQKDRKTNIIKSEKIRKQNVVCTNENLQKKKKRFKCSFNVVLYIYKKSLFLFNSMSIH